MQFLSNVGRYASPIQIKIIARFGSGALALVWYVIHWHVIHVQMCCGVDAFFIDFRPAIPLQSVQSRC